MASGNGRARPSLALALASAATCLRSVGRTEEAAATVAEAIAEYERLPWRRRVMHADQMAWTTAQSADLLIADCETRVGQEYTGGYGHMGPRQCGDLALKSGVKRLWLTHYFDYDEPDVMLAEARASGYFGETKVAHDGDRWEPEG